MSVIRQILNFYVNSSIHVSLAVVALVGSTGIILNTTLSKFLIFFVFFAAITGYNFVKYAGIAGLHHRTLTPSLRSIQVFSACCGIGLLYTAYHLSIRTLLCASFLGLITLFYAFPIIFIKKNLRALAGVKIFVIAGVWACVGVGLPVISENIPIAKEVVLLGGQYFFLVLALMIPFEIRDLKFDQAGLETIPQRYGITGAKVFGVSCVLLFVILAYLRTAHFSQEFLKTLVLGSVVTGFIRGAKENQSPYYTTVFVEAVPLLWFALLIA